MKLKRPLPSNRSLEQIRNHYLVEKAIAERLKQADREERKLIYSTMYNDLFSQVPDHPRLVRREDDRLTLRANKSKLALVRNFLDKSTVFAEFAPGDCRFAIDVAKYVKFVYGIDISDQRSNTNVTPDNFKLIVYDGYNLEEIEDNSIDIVFSAQLIEHFHPEDTKSHFELVHRILKEGGKYVFETPHSLSGPHDISLYFSDEPEGFHLKEWTYIEIKRMLKELKYSKLDSHWYVKGKLKMPYIYFEIGERMLGLFPKRHIRGIAKYLMPRIICVAHK